MSWTRLGGRAPCRASNNCCGTAYRERNPGGPLVADAEWAPERFHQMSHGESFIEVLNDLCGGPGLFVLDEPESALSFTGCLALVNVLDRIARSNARQAIVATHSPIVAATPGARILEVCESGLVDRRWDELELVQNWSAFLGDPNLYLQYVLDER